MPATIVLVSGDKLTAEADPDETRKRLTPGTVDNTGFVEVRLNGDKQAFVRPDHVAAVLEKRSGRAQF